MAIQLRLVPQVLIVIRFVLVSADCKDLDLVLGAVPVIWRFSYRSKFKPEGVVATEIERRFLPHLSSATRRSPHQKNRESRSGKLTWRREPHVPFASVSRGRQGMRRQP